jgi:tetratricopeptide (TPR) repeat protein
VDTSELLPSLAQGELQDTSAPELVAAVFRSRASGTLLMETEESEIRCFFRAGDMCGSGAFKGFQTLAHVLLTNDWVAALDIDSSREEAAGQGKRHGEVLVSRGLLTPDQLRTALGAQHTANLNTLLALTRAKYDWRGWEPPPPWAREVVVDPISCLIDALEQEQHSSRRRRVLEWMGPNAARLSLDWPELQGRVNLGPLERRAAALLALPRRLAEFVQASRLPQTRAESLLVTLLLAGGVELQPQAATEPPASRAEAQPARVEAPVLAEPTPPPAQIEPEPVEEGEVFPAPAHGEPASDPFAEPILQSPRERDDLLSEAEPAQDGGDLPPLHPPSKEEEALARLDSLSLDDVATAPPAARHEAQEEPLEIDHRPRQGAVSGGSTAGHAREELTFDHPPEQPAPAPAEDRSDDLRKKMVARGMRNMGQRSVAARDEPEADEEAAAPPPPAQLDESQLSAEDQRFVDEVRSRAKQAPTQNAYARLGVAPTASTEQVKTAYLALVRRFHPDRAGGPLANLQPEVQSLFGQLKEAYDNVATPEARVRYEAQLKSGGTRPNSRREEAGLTLKMGEVLLKKRDFEGALNKLRRSVDLEPTGDSLAALAWALVADPKATPQTKEEAASLINRALRAPGVTARTYYVAGVLWRTKDPDSAVDAFRKALELDPQNSDAALELRLIEQRRGKEKKTGGGVLSGLLFGKRKS